MGIFGIFCRLSLTNEQVRILICYCLSSTILVVELENLNAERPNETAVRLVKRTQQNFNIDFVLMHYSCRHILLTSNCEEFLDLIKVLSMYMSHNLKVF
jgi:hypothetical protein